MIRLLMDSPLGIPALLFLPWLVAKIGVKVELPLFGFLALLVFGYLFVKGITSSYSVDRVNRMANGETDIFGVDRPDYDDEDE